MSEPLPLSPRTLASQALGLIDERTRAIVPPIHLATTFQRDPDNLYRSGNSYGRPDNETVREAEALIGALEGGTATLVFGSGMSAAIALFLSLGPGAHVVAPKGMYWALRAWLVNEAPAHGISVDFVDAEDSQALTDANFVLTGTGGIVEIQATAEGAPFDDALFAEMLRLARAGIAELTRQQRAALGLATPG